MMKKIYESPEVLLTGVRPHGIVCSSMNIDIGGGTDDFGGGGGTEMGLEGEDDGNI